MRAGDAFLRSVGLPRERLFFAVVCAGALLLLSGLMLRHESQTPAARTFRDGFTVAEHTLRRVQDSANATAGSATQTTRPVAPVVGAENDAEDAPGARTTTIKTEGGDEITIKRAATTKGSTITTIQRHEDGKITIDTMAAETANAPVDEAAAVEEEARETLGDYEKLDVESVASIQRKETEQEVSDGEEEDAEEQDEAVIVRGERKVTVVQIARALDKERLAEDDDPQQDALMDESLAKKLQLVRGDDGTTR